MVKYIEEFDFGDGVSVRFVPDGSSWDVIVRTPNHEAATRTDRQPSTELALHVLGTTAITADEPLFTLLVRTILKHLSF